MEVDVSGGSVVVDDVVFVVVYEEGIDVVDDGFGGVGCVWGVVDYYWVLEVDFGDWWVVLRGSCVEEVFEVFGFGDLFGVVWFVEFLDYYDFFK